MAVDGFGCCGVCGKNTDAMHVPVSKELGCKMQ